MLTWFVVPFGKKANTGLSSRYPIVQDFSAQIIADGGGWAVTEANNQFLLAKVNASTTTLAAIAAVANVFEWPSQFTALNNSLVALTSAQQAQINNMLLTLGFTQSEINTAMGAGLTTQTLGSVLDFASSKITVGSSDGTTVTFTSQTNSSQTAVIDALVS